MFLYAHPQRKRRSKEGSIHANFPITHTYAAITAVDEICAWLEFAITAFTTVRDNIAVTASVTMTVSETVYNMLLIVFHLLSKKREKKDNSSRGLAGSTSAKAAFDAYATPFSDYQLGIACRAPILVDIRMLHNGSRY